MDREGTYEAHDGKQPPAPVHPPAAPPMPRRPPGAGQSPVAEWLATPRPRAEPGVWRFGYRPRGPEQDDSELKRRLVRGMVIPTVLGLVLWSLLQNGSFPYLWMPVKVFTPAEWWYEGTVSPQGWQGQHALIVYGGVVFGLLVYAVVRLSTWGEAVRYFVRGRPQPSRALIAVVAAVGSLALVWPGVFGLGLEPVPVVTPVLSLVALIAGRSVFTSTPVVAYAVYALITLAVLWPFARIGGWRHALRKSPAAPPPPRPTSAPAPAPAHWPQLRAAGHEKAADLLAAELLRGRMNDVDCARITRAWDTAGSDPGARAAFADTVARHGAAAWAHPSGSRDLPARSAIHDLLADQVRIGRFAEDQRNPYAFRGVHAALEPGVLGTSLLAVGPSGAGKTARLMRPVTEALALQALTGRVSVVAVCAAGSGLGPDDAYDVVIRPGDPASTHGLDLYADCADPDEAAAFLAEGLVGDLDSVDTRRAATALAQLLGPHRAAHGRFPSVRVLRALLEGEPCALADLRAGLDAAPDHEAMRRELDARVRQSGTPGDPCPALADRLALLDRPVFAGAFDGGAVDGEAAGRVFSLRAVAHHPLRVRVDLPEHGHEEAARLLARLLLAQFGQAVRTRPDRPHFACLVLDDAARTLTAGTVRTVQRLRTAKAGVVLGLRTVGEIPEPLQGPLYAAVGCRMAFSGVTTWDGRWFAESWGTERVETREVAQHTVYADQPMTRALHSLRRLVTGKAVTTDAVTVREVERERWSASDLAHAVPPGHAVLSLTSVRGEPAPPLLVDLRG
ncbi:ATP/GTP-binding protein [Streptomyces luteolus]|uniref:ATP/GTP-binding protein n=1 Tax=Streptomyces luteolus TaxID=3043615 RepID=A0ABT6SYW0_9ACTN|nr:ATP/GTP-binding protein [Streptomyces sp. B-S-A12]MDI3420801.1 ATP/GTP-binding protein [Streptomyces sp. B-S-A12]